MQFNLDEVFQIAEQIERNGASFYRTAARHFPEKTLSQLLSELADMEVQHEKVFKAMHAQLNYPHPLSLFDVNDETSAYLNAFASDYVFDLNTDPTILIKPETSPEELLKIAIGLEKDSIVFYYGLMSVLINQADKSQVDAIIKQEFSHIAQLTRVAADFKAK